MKLFRPKFALAGSLVVGACLVLAACAAPKINTRSHTDPAVNLASYKTYNFVAEPGTNRGGYSTPITGYFKGAISRELNARGYTLSESSPELLINFNTNARENVDIRSRPTTTTCRAPLRAVRRAAAVSRSFAHRPIAATTAGRRHPGGSRRAPLPAAAR